MGQIVIDIVMAVGGFAGGVEDVVRAWVDNIDRNRFVIRVFHMSQGAGNYLEGYDKAYYIPKKLDQQNLDLGFCVAAYQTFIEQYGEPHICMPTGWPLMTETVFRVRENNGYSYQILSWVHGTIASYDKTGFGSVRELCHADAHLVLSQLIESEIRDTFPEARTFVVGNPIQHAQIVDSHRGSVIAFVGRVVPGKRVDIILAALQKTIKPWKLRIVGDGSQMGEVLELIRSLGLEDRVECCGWRQNPMDYCRDAAALVVASDFEGFSMVAVQASAMGLPVISTPVGAIPDYIVEGVNGYLFAHEDIDGLAKILNGIGDGTLPLCSPKDCVASVEPYYAENYFKNVQEILEMLADEAIHTKASEPAEAIDVEDGIQVSVIVPCHNVAQYIDKCMEHLTGQTIGMEHIEIILVDDASTDDGATLDKLLAWEKKYPENIMVIPLEENVRQGGARNIGLFYARGTYTLYCDADDWLDPRAVAHLYKAARRYQCDVVEFDHKKVWDRSYRTSRLLRGEAPDTFTEIDGVETRKNWIMRDAFNGFCNKLYRTAFLKENDIRFAEGVSWEEPLFTYLVRAYETRHYYLSEVLYFYYQRAGSTMYGNYNKYDNMYTHDRLYEEAARRGLLETYREEFEYLYWFWYFHSSLLGAVQAGQFFSNQEFVEMQRSTREKVPDLKKNRYFQEKYGALPQLADLLYCDGAKLDMAELAGVYKDMLEELYTEKKV